MKKVKNKSRHLYPLLVVVVMLLVAGTFTKAFQQEGSLLAIPNPTPTPAPHKTYISEKLGISFTYLTVVSGRVNFFIREIGNTIYLYYHPRSNKEFVGSDAEFLNKIAPHAYFVEVFNKDPQQSFVDAIKTRFLNGYSEKDCTVHSSKYGHPRADESLQTVIIDFPQRPGQSRKEKEDLIAKCPVYTTSFNGVRYFMMDPKHHDKLLFVTIGQSNIPSGLGWTWDRTLKVLK